MVTAASDRRMRRRGRRRQQPGSTPADVGAALREARQSSDVTLIEIQDRTGVAVAQLEALEAGDLSRFPDLRSARTAVRRYGDLVQVDGESFAEVVDRHWGTQPGATNGNPTQSVYLTESVSAGHLSRYPGDGTHLRAFTQTDEVPGVRRAALPATDSQNGNGSFSITGSFPVVPTVFAPTQTVPLILRAAIWLTATLLVVALGALGVEHYQPRLLADIHVVHTVHTTTPTVADSGPAVVGGVPAHSAPPAHASPVSLTDTGVTSATVSVQASNYTVVVAAWAPCWTEVHTPLSFSPVFAATLQAGQVKDFTPADGQLSLNMGAPLVTVQVRIDGKTVPKWLFKPTSVPFTLNFKSTTA